MKIFRRRFRRCSSVVCSLTLLSVSTPALPAPSPHQARITVQTKGDTVYSRPGPFTFVKNAPADLRDYCKEIFVRKNAGKIAAMVIGTGLLIVADQYLVDKAKNLGDHLSISHTNYQKSFASTNVPLTSKSLEIEGPFDSGSALYFIGDGWIDLAIGGSFLTYGLSKSDNRALQTASEMAESILTSGAVVQAIKHVTGRESPFTTDVPGGVWRFFPNQYRYAQNVPEFDAFPTGHLAAAMATFTVINENYPEYKFIRPVGYTLMGLLSFQMMNNGVHWASDYPLGMALGYSFGRIAVKKGRRPKGEKDSFTIEPVLVEGGWGLKAKIAFQTFTRRKTA